MDQIKLRLAKLLAVKSIITIILTGIFAYLAVNGEVTSGQFLSIFTVVIAFYFGTQVERQNSSLGAAPTAASGAGAGSPEEGDGQ